VCAEAYNPDEEEDDAETRVFNALLLGFFSSDVLHSGRKFRTDYIRYVTSITIPFQNHPYCNVL